MSDDAQTLQVRDLITTTNEILSTHEVNNEDIPINLEEIIRLIERKTNAKILFREGSWSSEAIRGRLLRYEHKAVIEYASELNPCWRRFVTCKECCHLLLDSETMYTKDPVALINQLIGGQFSSNLEPEAELSEYMAVIGAIELLFPWKYRKQLYEKYINQEISLYKIASTFRIPGHYVEIAFGEKFIKLTDPIHTEFAQKK